MSSSSSSSSLLLLLLLANQSLTIYSCFDNERLNAVKARKRSGVTRRRGRLVCHVGSVVVRRRVVIISFETDR